MPAVWGGDCEGAVCGTWNSLLPKLPEKELALMMNYGAKVCGCSVAVCQIPLLPLLDFALHFIHDGVVPTVVINGSVGHGEGV